jgi:carboxylesterase type B
MDGHGIFLCDIADVCSYRTGAPGWLTSSAMEAAGYKANNGFRDQRTALLWLHKHLKGFGGDASNITLAGESAGGISVCYHLFSEQPLFKRMMSMSGTMLLAPPVFPDAAEASTIKAMGLSPDTAVEHMLKTDGQELIMKTMKASTRYVPTLDDDLCPTTFNFKSIGSGETKLPGQEWCEEAMIGDCRFDGNIQSLRLMHRKKGIAAAFCLSITKSLSSHSGLAERLLSAYGLTPETDDEAGLFKVLQVANDINFYIPTTTLTETLSEHMDTYVYRFNEPNPWDGPWKGHATHVLDIAFLTQNFNEFLDDKQKATAIQFAKDVITFVNGKQPWDRTSIEDSRAKVLGPHGNLEVVDDKPEKVGRRSIMTELGEEVGFDVLNDAFNSFMAPPPAV